MGRSGVTSAGILLFRRRGAGIEVLLGHPGGPFHAAHDLGAWTIPKGEAEPDEELLAVARREFHEETGSPVPAGPLLALGGVDQRSGKHVIAWAVEGDLDADTACSNTFTLEWPPHSGRVRQFPEIDRFAWFDEPEARRRILAAQASFLDRLVAALERGPDEPGPDRATSA